MKYLLVIQLTNITNDSFDDLIALEEKIEDQLGKEHQVDGHDMGSNEFNIFIFTNSPKEALPQIKNMMLDSYFKSFIVAYREANGEDYIVIWPEKFSENFKIC